MGVITVGTYIFVGNSGVLFFGHVVIVAVGAYATALTTLPRGLKQALPPRFPAGWQSSNSACPRRCSSPVCYQFWSRSSSRC
ncbi:hypothetical protein HUT06_25475 [Actinomadura sp. NAK00032]|nr:hypothetical protein HUT06_25475 [Actinomadura sp. NAK00032]